MYKMFVILMAMVVPFIGPTASQSEVATNKHYVVTIDEPYNYFATDVTLDSLSINYKNSKFFFVISIKKNRYDFTELELLNLEGGRYLIVQYQTEKTAEIVFGEVILEEDEIGYTPIFLSDTWMVFENDRNHKIAKSIHFSYDSKKNRMINKTIPYKDLIDTEKDKLLHVIGIFR